MAADAVALIDLEVRAAQIRDRQDVRAERVAWLTGWLAKAKEAP
jgi:hypothetical protein